MAEYPTTNYGQESKRITIRSLEMECLQETILLNDRLLEVFNRDRKEQDSQLQTEENNLLDTITTDLCKLLAILKEMRELVNQQIIKKII
uniref:Uncharacterized protein n=1 Tax=viral metagenome TaxID=1070528 RepID=A0A6M3JRF8_9ZZZZ